MLKILERLRRNKTENKTDVLSITVLEDENAIFIENLTPYLINIMLVMSIDGIRFFPMDHKSTLRVTFKQKE